MYKLILIAVFISLTHCKKVNDENKIFNKNIMTDSISKDWIKPDKITFEKKILNVFGVDINSYSVSQQKYSDQAPQRNKDIKILIPKFGHISESEGHPEVNLTQRYISWLDPEEDSISLKNLNKYIFYDDNNAFINLKNKKSGYLYYLLIDFGYTKDEKLVDFVLNEIGTDFTSDEKMFFAETVFIGATGVFGKYELRKDLIKKYYEKFSSSEFMYFSLAEKILNEKEDSGYIYEGNRSENAAFLLEYQLEYSEKQLGSSVYGGVDYVLSKFPEFLTDLRNNNAFNYPLLKYYIENFLESESYFIEDPDGFTNLRSSTSSSSNIIQKIKSGEKIEVQQKNGEWWLVKTKEGNTGYVHKSRLKSLE